MHHFFLPAPLSEEALAAPLTFSRKDWQHLFVLRLHEGEEFVLADGHGREHICRVTDVQKNSLTASVVASRDARASSTASSSSCRACPSATSSSSSSRKPSSSAPAASSP